LNELIADQFKLGAIDANRFEAVGPEVWLAPELALHLALILHELCTNAIKYGALSDAKGNVALTWRIQGGQLHLTWLEQGGPSVKAPSRRGFGTTLIEQSAKAEGGAAHANFRVDGISWNLIMPLPLAAAPRKQPAPEAEAVKLVEVAQSGKRLQGRRVLIVEDEVMIALEISAILEEAGIVPVGPAGTADQALQLIEAGEFDVALLDGNLHGKPVTEVAAALIRAKTPFLFVSGYGRANLPASFEHVGVLMKPFTEQQLLSEIETLVLGIERGIGLRAVSAVPREAN
jgi:CheY-like chemotaxis protein